MEKASALALVRGSPQTVGPFPEWNRSSREGWTTQSLQVAPANKHSFICPAEAVDEAPMHCG